MDDHFIFVLALYEQEAVDLAGVFCPLHEDGERSVAEFEIGCLGFAELSVDPFLLVQSAGVVDYPVVVTYYHCFDEFGVVGLCVIYEFAVGDFSGFDAGSGYQEHRKRCNG